MLEHQRRDIGTEAEEESLAQRQQPGAAEQQVDRKCQATEDQRFGGESEEEHVAQQRRDGSEHQRA